MALPVTSGAALRLKRPALGQFVIERTLKVDEIIALPDGVNDFDVGSPAFDHQLNNVKCFARVGS